MFKSLRFKKKLIEAEPSTLPEVDPGEAAAAALYFGDRAIARFKPGIGMKVRGQQDPDS